MSDNAPERVQQNVDAIRHHMNEIHEILGEYHMKLHSSRYREQLDERDVSKLEHIRMCLEETDY